MSMELVEGMFCFLEVVDAGPSEFAYLVNLCEHVLHLLTFHSAILFLLCFHKHFSLHALHLNYDVMEVPRKENEGKCYQTDFNLLIN